jgi:hypothetical protein
VPEYSPQDNIETDHEAFIADVILAVTDRGFGPDFGKLPVAKGT